MTEGEQQAYSVNVYLGLRAEVVSDAVKRSLAAPRHTCEDDERNVVDQSNAERQIEVQQTNGHRRHAEVDAEQREADPVVHPVEI